MAKYRKKPVVIEAEQFNANTTAGAHPFLGDGDPVNFHAGCGPNGTCSLDGKHFIETLEGPLIVSDGDWVIKGVKGEFYPCKPDVFEQTYEGA